MQSFQRSQELREWLKGTLIASVLVAPRDPGLSYDELLELGRRRSFGKGEILDTLRQFPGTTRYLPEEGMATFWLIDFNDVYANDPRSIDAYAFVCDQFELEARERTAAKAILPFDVLIERGRQSGLRANDVEAACASYLVTGQAEIDGTNMRWKGGYAHPRQMERRLRDGEHPASPFLEEVQDVVARRSDGRALSTDPIRAFADQLVELAHEDKRLWWHQVAGELRSLNPQSHPTSYLVLAAALAEGALTLMVRPAQQKKPGAFGAKTFDPSVNTTNWKFKDLLAGARHPSAGMVDEKVFDACMRLNNDRQRIHLGRYLPGVSNPPQLDIRPHEAEEALATTKRLLAAILEWLAEQGAPGGGP